MQTQNNLRKAFDHAAEENALLYFDNVDPLFTHNHAGAPDASDQSTAPATIEYFFDRVGAYSGVVILGIQHQRHIERAESSADLVVRFT